MKKNCLKLLILFVFFSSQMTINAQREGEVYFMFGDSVLYDNYRSNSAALLMIEKIAREIQPEHKLFITASASPEGEELHNLQLTRNRISSIKKYIINKTSLSESRIEIQPMSVDWKYALNVDALNKFPNKNYVYNILIDSTLDLRQKEHKISLLYGENVVEYLQNNLYPYMRNGYVTTFKSENKSNNRDSLISNVNTNAFHKITSKNDLSLFTSLYNSLGIWLWIISFVIVLAMIYFILSKCDISFVKLLKSTRRMESVDTKDDHTIIPAEGGGKSLKQLKEQPILQEANDAIDKESLTEKQKEFFRKLIREANKIKFWHVTVTYIDGCKNYNFHAIKIGPVVKAYTLHEIINKIKSNPETAHLLDKTPLNRHELKKIIRAYNYERLELKYDKEAGFAPGTTKRKGYIGRLLYSTPHEDLNGSVYAVPIWAHMFYKHDGYVSKVVEGLSKYAENR